MGCFNPVFLFVLYLLSLLNLLINIQYTTAQLPPQYVHHFCLGDNYTSGSTFQTNLNLLLPSLSSANNSITIKNGYSNATVGQTADTVYGSFQCRCDVSLEECQGCVRIGVEEIVNYRCPISKQAIIWYDTCMLRYSNEYYFNTMQDEPQFYLSNVNTVSDPDKFTQAVSDSLKRLAGELIVSNDDSISIKFATGDLNINQSTKVYGIVQCTGDISLSSCNRCLLGAIDDQLPNCCDGKEGRRVLRPSCNFRYESALFYNSTITASPPPLVSPPPSTITNTPNSNGNYYSSKLAISITVPSAIAGLFAIAFCFFVSGGTEISTTVSSCP